MPAKAKKSHTKKAVEKKEKTSKISTKKDSISQALSPLAEDLTESAQSEAQEPQIEEPQEAQVTSSLGLPEEPLASVQPPTSSQSSPSEPTTPQNVTSPSPETASSSNTPSSSSDLAPLGSQPQVTPPQTQASTPHPPSQQPAARPAQAETASTDSVITSSDEESSGSKKVVVIIFIILFLILSVLGGVFYYVSTYKGEGMKKEEAASPVASEVSPTPVSTDSAALNLKDFTIQVLNGSGTPGEAGRVEELLKKAGFEDIETGNADAYTYDETEVSIGKATPEAVYTAIEKALAESHVVTKSAEFRKVSSTFDAIIIVGSKSPKSSEEE